MSPLETLDNEEQQYNEICGKKYSELKKMAALDMTKRGQIARVELSKRNHNLVLFTFWTAFATLVVTIVVAVIAM